MTDLGGGVYVDDGDAWDDVGRHDALEHPEANGKPMCPVCSSSSDIERNTGRAGGILCWACMTVFTTAPGEWAATQGARELWEREYRRTDT